jgi:hypothetical protein
MNARAPAIALTLLAAACGNGGGAPADAGVDACSAFVGDPTQLMDLEVVVLDEEGNLATIGDNDPVPLIMPPQGGRVIFAGIRARHINTCGPVQITGSLRDGTQPTDRVVGLDGRPINLVASADGWAESAEPMQLASYSNIPVCPNHSSSRDIFGELYQLTIGVLDSGNRRGSVSVMVRPFCAEPEKEAACRCICKQGYVLGDPCPPDPPPEP